MANLGGGGNGQKGKKNIALAYDRYCLHDYFNFEFPYLFFRVVLPMYL